MDFYEIKERSARKGTIEIYPEFLNGECSDLMTQSGKFYAVWNEEKGLWSKDENDVQRIIDAELWKYYNERCEKSSNFSVLTLREHSSGMWDDYRNFVKGRPDNAVQLDNKIIFSNMELNKNDFASKKLSYPLVEGPCESYEQIISTLYEPEERAKLEWAIGAIISGDAKNIQKFIVLYGEAGTGKSTILNIIQSLFSIKTPRGKENGYYAAFEAKALASNNNTFATEVFRNNPLVAIQHDGDLSRIEDNSKLNSLIAHEEMVMNQKFKSAYMSRANCFLFMGTNRPVKITDAKSGIIRRLIDVRPSGKKITPKKYEKLMGNIPFELSGIAYHCLQVYKSMGKNYYSGYRPVEMMFKTDPFYNFVQYYYFDFKEEDGIQLKTAWEMYQKYCNMSLIDNKLQMYKFREELKNYFHEFSEFIRIDGKQIRSYYSGFIAEKFDNVVPNEESAPSSPWLVFEDSQAYGGRSVFDNVFAEAKAQLASPKTEKPMKAWSSVKTILKNIDVSKVHYVWFSEKQKNLICVDFDIKDEQGNKCFDKNYEAALKWPKTYAELSKSGGGIHLYYFYDGDVSLLSSIFEKDIEIKTFLGDSSLRRRLTKCNDIPIATISSGLPLKGEHKKMINFEAMRSEKVLRDTISRCLLKEYDKMPSTTQNVNFIKDMLDKQYDNGVLSYDIRDMAPAIEKFCAKSSNQSVHCLKQFNKMHFVSKDVELKEAEHKELFDTCEFDDNAPIVFFDVEVYPNLFVIVIKEAGKEPIGYINPSPLAVAELLKFRLIGFNNRKYDNHILYARIIGENNYSLYLRSKGIINGDQNMLIGRAYGLSYTDIYDYSNTKQSLKRWEIELKKNGFDTDLKHDELDFPWDEQVPEDKWDRVVEYCKNDVRATEALHNYLQADFKAREMLAAITGLTVNHTTNQLTTALIMGDNKQIDFVYTDLSEMYPGYEYSIYGIDKDRYIKDAKGNPIFKTGKSIYRGEDPSEGGYVYAEPGAYKNVALLDVESMHPTSTILLNAFGKNTKNFENLKKARIHIKHGEFDEVKGMFGGRLAPYLSDKSDAKDLSYALKIAINSVYGLTSAKFDNKLRDPKNVDNIVAKRGALFMIDLKHAVQEKGYTVAHIKTDSIKIPDADDYIINFVMEFGKKYGYNFEHEDTYERMCLINDAVYIAKYKEPHTDKETGKETWWTATGAQFKHPYVFKYCFSKEPIQFYDMCETRSVTTSIYLDMNENMPEDKHNYIFVGKTGLFSPVKPGCGGGLLMRIGKYGDKYSSVGGSKGYRWIESEILKSTGNEDYIDISYFRSLVDDAIENIEQFVEYDKFVNGDDFIPTNAKITDYLDITSDELPF